MLGDNLSVYGKSESRVEMRKICNEEMKDKMKIKKILKNYYMDEKKKAFGEKIKRWRRRKKKGN